MTIQETAKILFVMKATYPKYYSGLDAAEVRQMTEAWHMMLAEYEYNSVAAALKAYTLTNASGYPPTPGQIVDKIADAVNETDDGMVAWTKVRKALRNSYYGAEEEYGKLPPLVQKALGGASTLRSWGQTPKETLETVTMSQFLTGYKAVCRRAEEEKKIPEQVLRLMRGNDGRLLVHD